MRKILNNLIGAIGVATIVVGGLWPMRLPASQRHQAWEAAATLGGMALAAVPVLLNRRRKRL